MRSEMEEDQESKLKKDIEQQEVAIKLVNQDNQNKGEEIESLLVS